VDAAGHEVVHQVVATGDGVEDIGDHAGLLLGLDFPVSEVGRVLIVHHLQPAAIRGRIVA
jgi:hypothetical protein